MMVGGVEWVGVVVVGGGIFFFTTRVHTNNEEALRLAIFMSSRPAPLFCLPKNDIGAAGHFFELLGHICDLFSTFCLARNSHFF